MGIKISIKKDDLPKKYQKYNLIETVDGISDTVYLLDDLYVLKIFEKNKKKQIKNEQKLLLKLQQLKIPKILDSFKIKNRFAVIYTQIAGKSLKQANFNEIKEIAIFLKQMHSKTYHLKSSNKRLFQNKRLENLIKKTNKKKFFIYFRNISLKLENNGIIHGDIFLDNVKFNDGKLSGVYDFSEACEGDFLLDLAIIALSWCFDKNRLNIEKLAILLINYGYTKDIKSFLDYIKYALLYYLVTRYLNQKNYKELEKRLLKLFKK